MAIDLGDVVTLEFPVLTSAQVYANADTVTLTISLPDGTTVSPSVTNPPAETGRYRYDYPTVQAGRHLVRWVATDPTSAYTDAFDVRPTDPPLIVSLAGVKQHLGKAAADTTDDEELREFIEAATAVIEEHRAEVVVRRAVVEDVDAGSGVGAVQLGAVPVQSVTSVVSVDGATTWDVADLHLDGRHGIVSVQSGPAFYGRVRITVIAGRTVVPANYTLAAKIIVAHLWETQQQPGLGPRGPFGDGDALTPTGRGFAIPNRAVELLGRRPPLVA